MLQVAIRFTPSVIFSIIICPVFTGAATILPFIFSISSNNSAFFYGLIGFNGNHFARRTSHGRSKHSHRANDFAFGVFLSSRTVVSFHRFNFAVNKFDGYSAAFRTFYASQFFRHCFFTSTVISPEISPKREAESLTLCISPGTTIGFLNSAITCSPLFRITAAFATVERTLK